MKKIYLKIEGMSCSACSTGLEKYLNHQEKIISASVNLVLSQALIEYEDSLTIQDINQMIKKAGFKSLGIYNQKIEKKQDHKIVLILFAFLSLLVLYISMSSYGSFACNSILAYAKTSYSLFCLAYFY